MNKFSVMSVLLLFGTPAFAGTACDVAKGNLADSLRAAVSHRDGGNAIAALRNKRRADSVCGAGETARFISTLPSEQQAVLGSIKNRT